MRQLTAAEVTFEVTTEPEDLEVRGNVLSSGDDDYDKEYEDRVLARLDRGEVEAWCCVAVKATWKGFHGTEYLGGVTLSEDDTQADLAVLVDEHGMKESALASLNQAIGAVAAELDELIEGPATLD